MRSHRLALAAVALGVATLTATFVVPTPTDEVVHADSGEAGLRFFEDQFDGLKKSVSKKFWEVARNAGITAKSRDTTTATNAKLARILQSRAI